MKYLSLVVSLIAILFFSFSSPVHAQQSDTEAELVIVKYSDYQCPACQYYYELEKQLKAEFGNRVRFETKHFPLAIHQHAQLASRAVEAARKQGKYAEMHELIFMGQSQWARTPNAEPAFIGYARSLDLDIEQFRQDMNSADMQRIVMADRREGINLDVNATPTYFINGQKVSLPRYYEPFKNTILEYLPEEN